MTVCEYIIISQWFRIFVTPCTYCIWISGPKSEAEDALEIEVKSPAKITALKRNVKRYMNKCHRFWNPLRDVRKIAPLLGNRCD